MSRVYVLGGEQSDYERNWSKEGKSLTGMFREIIEDGLLSTNISVEEIGKLNIQNKVGAFVGNFAAENYLSQGHLGAFLTEVDDVFYGLPSARYEAACASGSVAIDAAVAKIKSQEYDLALVVGIEMMKTVDSKLSGAFLGSASYYEKEAQGIDFPFPNLFSKLADATIEKYKLETERYMNNLAEISYINYSNAKRNPKAQTRNWFMSKAQAKMRKTESNQLVGGRLAVSDCSQTTDGAAMVFLASEEYAHNYCKRNNLQISELPYIKGWGHRNAPLTFDSKIKESINDPYLLKWTRVAVKDAYTKSGLTVEDMDLFEVHDCFTSSEYASLSCLGLTEPGKEYEAIESGLITFEGDKPVNPSGGLIGGGHPVGASGVRMLLDLYKQVANKAGDYQVENAKNAMMLNIGGSATTNYTFVLGKD
ncbi:acetyl-CoA acetyltransferase [Paenibacillus sp. FSL P4-0081]|uniref:acetyl-CoA acetyltransferase n=1 Tax=Paenibacillus sp. FSL P4-0081 TaxID=1536769 RepID=UPI0004F6DC92|nr:acetyl-CoA acetyltransferase [Paenibacillus sp. FSL P4-0081]AIQ31987.1 acetyl-CoA acetyltransferase [Paenibacillus sp. FSL P4-0081]